MCAHRQIRIYNRAAPLDFESWASWRALFVAGYRRLMAKTNNNRRRWLVPADLQPGSAFSMRVIQRVRTCVYIRYWWCKQARTGSAFQVLFKQSRSGWDPSTVHRVRFENCAPHAFMCYSHYHYSGLHSWVGKKAEEASWVIALCLQINALSSNHPSIQPRPAWVF